MSNITNEPNSNNIVNQNLQKPILNIINDKHMGILDDILRNYNDNFDLMKHIHQKTTKIHFDSRDRNTNPKNILDNNYKYIDNSFTFYKDQSLIYINCKDHGLTAQDKIIVQNVKSKIFKMKGNIEMKKDSNFIKINYKDHGFTHEYSKYNDSIIELKGILGNLRNNSYINNIPISILNKKHIVHLKTNVDKLGSPDYFYIKISSIPNKDFIDTNSDITIIMQDLAGVPLNIINSNYPININQHNGFLSVSKIIDENNFVVNIDEPASIDLINTGGNGILICKVKDYIEGFPDSNHYKIFLSKTLHSVRQIKIISSEFPNTEKVIKSTPEIKRNNKLYWQNLDDGEYIYSLEITPGNYTPTSLIQEIQSKFDQVKRILFTDLNVIDDGTNARLEKGEFHKVTVEINSFTDVVQFKSYNIVTLNKAIAKVNYNYNDNHTRIKVNHVDHNLTAGDTIVIENTISTSTIPSTVLNSTHIIESVQDENNYIIKLPLYNDSKTTDNTGGGTAINILIPIKFRLFFDRDDTPGLLLGFRHVGVSNAITPFGFTVANNIAYENDYFQDSVGKNVSSNGDENIVQNNVLSLSGDNYIIMTCNIFKDNESLSSGKVQPIFSKILLSDVPGNILFNQHVQLAEYLHNPINNLSMLEFKFFSPDGELYNFNGMDHSFTLEFFEDILSNDTSNVSTKSGIPQNISYLKKENFSD